VYGLFVQDDIQVSRRLTLNVGAVGVLTPPRTQDRDFEVFDEAIGQLRAQNNAYSAQRTTSHRASALRSILATAKRPLRRFWSFYNQGRSQSRATSSSIRL
jgi:hypothetical protein